MWEEYEMVEEEYTRAEKMHAAVKALTSSGLHLGFNSWLSYVNEAMEAYQVMRRAASAFSPNITQPPTLETSRLPPFFTATTTVCSIAHLLAQSINEYKWSAIQEVNFHQKRLRIVSKMLGSPGRVRALF